MSTKLLITAAALAFLALLYLSGCNGGTSHDHSHGNDDSEPAHQHATTSLTTVALNHYIAIQETLAADSMAGVGAHAREMAKSLANPAAINAAQAIAQTDDIDAARREFETVSIALLTNLKAHGVPEGTYYEAHCPMAFDNRGASWIQTDTTVNNPYFGSRMLRCGDIRQQFASDSAPR